MQHSITNYQTSFRAEDPDGETFTDIQRIVFEWLTTKETDREFRRKANEFAYRAEWPNLYRNRSSITTDTYLEDDTRAWAMRYTHADKELGPQRFWYTDIGLWKSGGEVVVSVRVSFARNDEDLRWQTEEPRPSVPYFVRRILETKTVYSGRREFKLIQIPVVFGNVGQGKLLWDFITSPERRYPLIVFNGDSEAQRREAKALAIQLAGKCQIATIAENPDLAKELSHFVEKEYRVSYGKMRVFFPFSRRQNSVSRHRWYDVASPEYVEQREGILVGLLRNNSLIEPGAVESVLAVRQLISRAKLAVLRSGAESQSEEMRSFYQLFDEVERERNDYKLQSEHYANDVDSLEEQVRQLNWKAQKLQSRLESALDAQAGLGTDTLLPALPKRLVEAVNSAAKFYPRLLFTEDAYRSARASDADGCVYEAWEIFGHLSNVLHPIKFDEAAKHDLEAAFRNRTGYELAMSEGRNIKRDSRLMALREITHDGRKFDITPHVKHGNKPPKMLRIHFAFDEERMKIIVGFVGSHMENATSRKL